MNKEPITLHLETFNNEEYILADECIEAIGLHRRTNSELHQTIEEKDKEIKRLNNILEELEKYLEEIKDKEIEVYINGEKVDITDIYEPLKQGEYFYKENDKWYVHKLKNVSFVIEEDKKIEKLGLTYLKDDDRNEIIDKINEIIDKLNKGD